MATKKTTAPTKNYVTESRARDIADDLVRQALREQARALEEHLTSIHERLTKLERK